jgi:hypothetical protein
LSMVTAPDETDELPAEVALAEAISVAIRCILMHESNEAKRRAAIDVLIECHRRALLEAEVEALRAVRLN